MPVEILVVPDQVLPVSTLPNATLTPLTPTSRNPFTFADSTGEPAFDRTPTARKISIVRWQSPKAMQMVRQDDDRFHAERAPQANGLKCATQ
jgi:hypothetical protein